MSVEPFSSEHLRMLDQLPEQDLPRRHVAGIFVEIGHPVMVSQGRQSARRRRGWRHPLELADALTLAHIYVRILEGRYSAIDTDAAKQARIFSDIDNCVRSHVRREVAHQKRFSPLGDRAETVAAGDLNYLEREARLLRVDAEVAVIRNLPASGVDRLLLLLLTHPAHVERPDLAEARSASRVVLRRGRLRRDGITRSIGETSDLIALWLARSVDDALRRSERAMRGYQRRSIAWILRGPPGSRDASQWSRADLLQAENWLDHRRSRVLQVLAESGPGCSTQSRAALSSLAVSRRS